MRVRGIITVAAAAARRGRAVGVPWFVKLCSCGAAVELLWSMWSHAHLWLHGLDVVREEIGPSADHPAELAHGLHVQILGEVAHTLSQVFLLAEDAIRQLLQHLAHVQILDGAQEVDSGAHLSVHVHQ